MIAKHIPMKSIKKSDFSELTKYLTDDQNKNERVGYVSFTNCEAQTLDGVIAEVLATQHQNKRAESDRTYHLLISFRPGEQPDNETIQAIEERICDGLGFGEHQRVSAVHHDTDNLHLHIAINKIHPIRHTIHDPYYDHKILGQLCEKLEKEYGLEPDNHKVQKRGAENRAADMENHAGIESLLGWISRECKDQIKAAKSWDELHKVMSENGLELQERGNGFVVTSEDGTMVKASSIDRDLSKGKLEGRLGPFKASPEHQARTASKPVKRYKVQPMRTRVNTVELYTKYRTDQQNRSVLRTEEWTKARDRKNKRIEAAKQKGRLKRTAIKHIVDGGLNKKILYGTTSKTLKEEIKKIHQDYLKERQEIYDKYQRNAWADWLRKKATDGDQEALNALRAREAAKGLKGNTVGGVYRHNSQQATKEQDSITKKGTIIYRDGVRDDGSRLKVAQSATPEELQGALRMAMDRYGESIAVNGTSEFKEQIVQAAVAANLSITFADAALERSRQDLLQTTTKEALDAQEQRRQIDSGRDAGSERTYARSNQSTENPEQSKPIPSRGIQGRPGIAMVGRQPPPSARNRLRRLSELPVVRVNSGSEMLLSSDVFNNVEHRRPKPTDSMRRDIVGARAGVDEGLAAADKYIKEREEKRLKIFDILKHSRYNYNPDAVLSFAGVRQIDGQALALLQNKDEIMVLPIDAATMKRLKRMAIGDPVTVSSKGVVSKPKGRRKS